MAHKLSTNSQVPSLCALWAHGLSCPSVRVPLLPALLHHVGSLALSTGVTSAACAAHLRGSISGFWFVGDALGRAQLCCWPTSLVREADTPHIRSALASAPGSLHPVLHYT